jgi:hypothetical protein
MSAEINLGKILAETPERFSGLITLLWLEYFAKATECDTQT